MVKIILQGFIFDRYNIVGKFFTFFLRVCQLVIFDEGSRMHVIIRTRAYIWDALQCVKKFLLSKVAKRLLALNINCCCYCCWVAKFWKKKLYWRFFQIIWFYRNLKKNFSCHPLNQESVLKVTKEFLLKKKLFLRQTFPISLHSKRIFWKQFFYCRSNFSISICIK